MTYDAALEPEGSVGPVSGNKTVAVHWYIGVRLRHRPTLYADIGRYPLRVAGKHPHQVEDVDPAADYILATTPVIFLHATSHGHQRTDLTRKQHLMGRQEGLQIPTLMRNGELYPGRIASVNNPVRGCQINGKRLIHEHMTTSGDSSEHHLFMAACLPRADADDVQPLRGEHLAIIRIGSKGACDVHAVRSRGWVVIGNGSHLELFEVLVGQMKAVARVET